MKASQATRKMREVKLARVVESGKKVQVYRHPLTGKWIDFHDNDEEYHTWELEFE